MINQGEKVLIIDSDEASRRDLENILAARGFYACSVPDRADLLAQLVEQAPDVVFAALPAARIATLVEQMADSGHPVPVVAYAAVTSAHEAVELLRAGAEDLVLKPVSHASRLDDVLQRQLERVRLARLNQRYRQELEDANKELRNGISELRADHAAGLKVQMKMLPESHREFVDVTCEHEITPSLYLSGDFLDYFPLDNDRLMFYIADVSGHGASSAFVTVLLKNLTNRLQRNFRRGSSDELTCPARFLHRVNKELLEAGLGKHLTMFVGIFDRSGPSLTYAVGAHFPMPILVDRGTAAYLEGSGLPIGLFDHAEYQVMTREVSREFRLWLFSDGILELINAPDLISKEKKLLDLVRDERQTIAALNEALGLSQVAELPDDVAVMCVSGRVSADV